MSWQYQNFWKEHDNYSSTNLCEYLHNTDPNDETDTPSVATFIRVPEDVGTIQKAIDCSISGGEVWIEAGTYKPGAARSDSFSMKDNVEVYGGFDGDETLRDQRDWAANVTILSGDIDAGGNDDSYHVVTGASSGAMLDGFTITKGYANGGGTNANGGGMYNRSCSPKVSNCTFTDNHADLRGGAMYNDGSGSGNTAIPTITNCIFSNNEVTDSQANGGAIHNFQIGGAPQYTTNCIFEGNEASAGDKGNGGAVRSTYSKTFLTNCVFVGNSAAKGGAFNANDQSTGNIPVILNCTFSGNSATESGKAIYNSSGPGTSTVSVINSILWDGGNEIVNNGSGASTNVRYSDIEGTHFGDGNIASVPSFVDDTDPYGDGFALKFDSPCIDRADGNVDPTTYILGNSRYDDTNTTNNGIGTPNYVDMGPYEFQPE